MDWDDAFAEFYVTLGVLFVACGALAFAIPLDLITVRPFDVPLIGYGVGVLLGVSLPVAGMAMVTTLRGNLLQAGALGVFFGAIMIIAVIQTGALKLWLLAGLLVLNGGVLFIGGTMTLVRGRQGRVS